MSKKKNKNVPVEEKKETSEYYKINKDAVSRLVNASKESAPKVSQDEIDKVSGKKTKFKIPDPIKVIFFKWWFAGATYFFFGFGLGTVVPSQIDLLIILGMALGAVTDLLTNNVLKHFEPYDRAWDKYMFISVRKFWSLFLNVIYGGVLLYIVIYIYNIINIVWNNIVNTEGQIYLKAEPLFFGVCVLGIDMLFILVKNVIKKIFEDAKAGNRR